MTAFTPTLTRTARLAGLSYLGMGLTGMLAFLVIRTQIHAPGDPAGTLANLVENEGLVRLGLALDFGLIIAQCLAALYFYQLFRSVNAFAAASLAAFGFMNAIAIMVGTMATITALQVALDPGLAPGGDQAAAVQALYEFNAAAWGAGGLFFGLWLIPMGRLVITSGWMPRPMGWVLIAGGTGYLLSAFATALAPDASAWLVDGLTIPATIGEFWMIGYLLVFGVRPRAGAALPTDDAVPAGIVAAGEAS